MTNRPAPFRQADIARALKAAIKAGMQVAQVEIDRKGTIVLRLDGAATPPRQANSWDDA